MQDKITAVWWSSIPWMSEMAQIHARPIEDFQSTADGPLHEAFHDVPENTPGRLEVEQECESAVGVSTFRG